MIGLRGACQTAGALALVAAQIALAADSNVLFQVAALETRLLDTPFEIVAAKKARDLREDVALRSDVRFADGLELRIKIRPANQGGTEFNNEPRYERAAYVLQQAFLDEPEFVVPVTVLRLLPKAQLKPFVPRIRNTFRGSDEVLSVIQYWLQNVTDPSEAWDPARFDADPGYARHIANVNVLTYLIEHGDSNKGNVMLSTDAANPRAFLIDSGVAFRSPASDRGVLWKSLRVPRAPRAAIERLRAFDANTVEMLLGTVGQWELRDGRFIAVAPTPRFNAYEGVRRKQHTIQIGLTTREVREVEARRRALLARVDDGTLGTF